MRKIFLILSVIATILTVASAHAHAVPRVHDVAAPCQICLSGNPLKSLESPQIARIPAASVVAADAHDTQNVCFRIFSFRANSPRAPPFFS